MHFIQKISLVLGPNTDFKHENNLDEEQDRQTYIKSWYRSRPRLVKLFLVITIVAYLCQVRWTTWYDMMLNPWAVVYRHQWYRLFTSQYVSYSLLHLIVGLPLFAIEFQIYEQKWGTIVTLIDFLWRNLLMNLSFMQIELLLFFHSPGKILAWGNSGYWSITIAYITSRCLKDPLGYTNYYLFPKKMKNFHYLFAVIAVYSVLRLGFPMISVVAVMMGIIQTSIFENNIYKRLLSLGASTYNQSVGSDESHDPTDEEIST
jgi:hypothetical protein